MMRTEGFLARQRRLIVHADFHAGEVVILGNPIGTSLRRYRGEGRVGQFFSRLFGLGVTLTSSVMVLGGVLVVVQPLGWLPDVGGTAFAAGSCYLGLYHLAGWRCMRRHRSR